MKFNKSYLGLFIITLIFAFNQLNSYASIVEPDSVDGSNCPEIQNYEIFTIENPENSSYSNEQMTISLELNDEKNKVQKWSANTEIHMVYVKGVTKGYLYNYIEEGIYSDLSLYPPISEGGYIPEITQISFYYKSSNTYKPEEVEEEQVKPEQESEDNIITEIDTTEKTEVEPKKELNTTANKSDLPETGEKDNFRIYVAGVLIIFSGFGLMVYNRKSI